MNNLFLTTRYTDDIYQLIVNLCAKDINKKNKEINIDVIKLKKFPDAFFLLICFKYLLQGKFFDKEKTVLLEYKKINFGKKLLSSTYKNFNSYVSVLNYFYTLFKNVYVIGKTIKTANYYVKNYNFKYVYIDHIEYLNGIYFDIFMSRKKTIYTNHYPNNIIKTTNKNAETTCKIPFKKKKILGKQKKQIKKIASRVYGSIENHLPWMKHTAWSNSKFKDLDKYDYIIYAHSFTDSQLGYGFDGFTNTLEWLIFTIEELRKRKANFIVKPHPNFYGNMYIVDKWDKKIYLILKKKFRNSPNILFLDEPILNRNLISKLNKKCITITKHGSIQLEMIYHNFKVISSNSNLIDSRHSLTNSWKNKIEYKKLLNKKWNDLKFANKNNFLIVNEFLFMNKNSTLGKNFYLNVLTKYMLKKNLIAKNSSHEETLSRFSSLKNKEDIIKNIKIPIQTI
jgi:hypothetical protein